MKEAFGGTFTLKLLMVFFIIYVTFLGVALQIAKCYRIKNGVINILEQNQYKFGDEAIEGENGALKTYLDSIPYNASNNVEIQKKCTNDNKDENAKFIHGICIVRNSSGSSIDDSYYYKVNVYLVAEFPFLGVYVPLTISGETMTIRNYK